MIVQDKKWIFKNFDSAYEYANLFNTLNKNFYSSIETAVMFRRVGDYLKYALNKKYISKDDLYTTDDEVINKVNINLKGDDKLGLLWKRMNSDQGYENNPDNYDAEVYCKSRVIDPLCQHNGEIKRVSDIEPSWRDVIKKESEPKRYFLKFSD